MVQITTGWELRPTDCSTSNSDANCNFQLSIMILTYRWEFPWPATLGSINLQEATLRTQVNSFPIVYDYMQMNIHMEQMSGISYVREGLHSSPCTHQLLSNLEALWSLICEDFYGGSYIECMNINSISSPSPWLDNRRWDWKFPGTSGDLVFLMTGPIQEPAQSCLLRAKGTLSRNTRVLGGSVPGIGNIYNIYIGM